MTSGEDDRLRGGELSHHLPEPPLNLVVLGDVDSGADTGAVRSLAADLQLTALLERAEPRVLDIPELCRAVLDEAARRARCVERLVVVVTDVAEQTG